MIRAAVGTVGSQTIHAWHHLRRLLAFWGEVGVGVSRVFLGRGLRVRRIVESFYDVGVSSLPVMMFSLLFISMMMVVEFSFHMKLVIRQDSLVPAFSTLLMVRELGPIVTSLLLASRVGAGIAAEIGTMKVTEQVDALRLLSVDVVDFMVVPRFLACILANLILCLFSIASAFLGAIFLAAPRIGYSSYEYFNSMFTFARPSDLYIAIAKSVVFGAIVPLFACYFGLRCRPGAQGVGEAATRSVVTSSLAIIGADFLLTYLFYAI